jgi:hypothetical protein
MGYARKILRKELEAKKAAASSGKKLRAKKKRGSTAKKTRAKKYLGQYPYTFCGMRFICSI